MRTYLFGQESFGLGHQTPQYAPLTGGDGWNAGAYFVTRPIPCPGTFSNLQINLRTAPTLYPFIFNLYVNGVPVGLTCTVAVGSTYAEDVNPTHAIHVDAGDLVCIVATYTSVPGNTPLSSWCTTFVADDPTLAILLGGVHFTSGYTCNAGLGMGASENSTTVTRMIMPLAGRGKALYVAGSVSDPNVLNVDLYMPGYVARGIILNGVGTPVAFDSAFNAGNLCFISTYKGGAGAPASMDVTYGVAYAPTTANRFAITIVARRKPSAALGYSGYTGGSGQLVYEDTPETSMGANLFPCTRVASMWFVVATAPGGVTTRSITVRKYTVGDTGLTVTLTGAQTTNSAVLDVIVPNKSVMNAKHAYTGSPASTAYMAWSLEAEAFDAPSITSLTPSSAKQGAK